MGTAEHYSRYDTRAAAYATLGSVEIYVHVAVAGGNFGSKADDVLTIPPNLAAKAWRISHTSFLGLSKLQFNGPKK